MFTNAQVEHQSTKALAKVMDAMRRDTHNLDVKTVSIRFEQHPDRGLTAVATASVKLTYVGVACESDKSNLPVDTRYAKE